ncbi:MAG: metalloregulator ArsR/SmtB family transcription factor [Candidatus Neomarinimicrobiota bacterium]
MKDSFERSCVRSYVDKDKLISLRADLAQNIDLERHAEILAMMADPTRLKILYSLATGGELCVCDLADTLDKEVSAISHQLRRLRDRGLVKNRRDGLTIYYRLAESEECRKACELINRIFETEESELVYES